jgi:RNA polymerase sigma-70 factor, ECF subfamily
MKRRFEQLVNSHGARLLQLAGMMLRSASEAEDIVQDCLVKLWHQLPRLREGGELAWLITCTRNACLDRLRSERRRGELLRSAAVEPGLALHDSESANDPQTVNLGAERARQLHQAIAELPEPGRSLLILRDIQDLDVASVAVALELSENQVKVYTFRARRALRQKLERADAPTELCHEACA